MSEAATSVNPGLSQPLLAKRTSPKWMISALLTTAIVALPVLSVIFLAFFPEENIWPHLIETTLPRYLTTTLKLMIGVGALTLVIGLASAWAVTMCEFPGRKFFEWAMLLPFAVPAYVIAYVYTDLLQYAGPVQGALRDWFGWQSARDYWFPEIRSIGGAISMLKVQASEMLGRVVDRAVQIYGGAGYCRDLPIERYYRDARIARIYDGTSEIHRMVMARQMMKGDVGLFDIYEQAR